MIVRYDITVAAEYYAGAGAVVDFHLTIEPVAGNGFIRYADDSRTDFFRCLNDRVLRASDGGAAGAFSSALTELSADCEDVSSLPKEQEAKMSELTAMSRTPKIYIAFSLQNLLSGFSLNKLY